MAWIDRLRIDGLRNLLGVDVTMGEVDGWLLGANGAGKTTVLEAVYLLSRGASFRGRRHGSLTSRGRSATRIEGLISIGGSRHRQLWRSAGGSVAEADRRLSFPVRLVGSAMHTLVEGEPALRRRFVDWNLFHVEPRFAPLRARFRRAAAQRNAWLRSGANGSAIWDGEYAACMGQIADFRCRLFHDLSIGFRTLTEQLDLLPGVDAVWRSELPGGEDLNDALARRRAGDVSRGYSQLSPSRADFRFEVAGAPWVGSRGQNKLAGILLQIAADGVLRLSWPEPAVWLVDDPAAELDRDSEVRVLEHIRRVGGQVLVTSLSERPALESAGRDQRVFHVKQGAVMPTPTDSTPPASLS